MSLDEESDDENFCNCTGEERQMLQNVTLVYVERQVRVIKDPAFYGCTRLSRVSFNRGLEVTGEKAFGSCRSIRSIKIPGVQGLLRVI
jgi:hypothetical protein